MTSQSGARRIVYYNHTATVSGAEYVLLSILQGLNRDFFRPVVICPEGDLATRVTAMGVEHRLIAQVSARFTRSIGATSGYLRELLAVVQTLHAILRAERPALVHANSVRAGLVASGAARGLGFPVLWHLHDILPQHPFSQVIRQVAQRSRCTHMLAVSHATANAFVAPGGKRVVRKPAHVVYNSVDLQRFQASDPARFAVRKELGLMEEEVALGAIAQITPRKRQLELVQAFARYAGSMPAARLFLVGEAQFNDRNRAYGEQMRQAVAQSGLGDRIVLLGRRADMPALINAMDIVVLNSDREPLGLSLMEGLATQKPAVGTRVDGIPEVVADGVDGLLSEADDAAAMMNNIAELVGNPERRSSMGRAGRLHMEASFSPDLQMRGMHALYNELISLSTGTVD